MKKKLAFDHSRWFSWQRHSLWIVPYSYSYMKLGFFSSHPILRGFGLFYSLIWYSFVHVSKYWGAAGVDL